MSSDSLIERVLALEAHADRIVFEAHEQARQTEAQASSESTLERTRLEEELEERVAAFAAQAELEYDHALERQQATLRQQLAALDQVTGQRLTEQADQVLASLTQE